MSHDSLQDDAPIREEVVAYLDRELDAESSRRIEERAAVEPETRRILEDFDRTWHLLDELDSTPAGDDFTRTTLEMVALAAADDAAKAQAEAPRRRWKTRLMVLAGLVTSAAAGFFIVAALLPDPNAQLLQELPLLENVDEYRDIESIDFLLALEKENLFTKDAESAAVSAAAPSSVETIAAESIAERRRRVEAMTADQREDLFGNEKQFRDMSSDEQQHIRELHAAIMSNAQRDQLLAVMHRYSKWLEDLPVLERGKLHRMTLPQRVATIKIQLSQRKRPNNEIQLDVKSRLALARWLERFVSEHGAGLMPHGTSGPGGPGPGGPGPGGPGSASGPGGPGEPPPDISKLSPQEQHRVFRAMAYHGWRMGDPAFRLQLSDAERASLRASLTPEIRAQLEARPKPEQAQIVAGWLRETAATQFDERLAEFFESTLNDQERDKLMSLPGDEMYAHLREEYMRHLTKQMNPGEPPRRNDQQSHGDHEHRGRHGNGPGGPGGKGRWPDHSDAQPENGPKPDKGPPSPPAAPNAPPAK